MEHEPIKLRIDVSIGVAKHYRTGLQNVLIHDRAEDYLYDCLCSWLWRYMHPESVNFDLKVNVTVAK